MVNRALLLELSSMNVVARISRAFSARFRAALFTLGFAQGWYISRFQRGRYGTLSPENTSDLLKTPPKRCLFAALLCGCAFSCWAQSAPPASAAMPDPLAGLDTLQKAQFREAADLFAKDNFAEAEAILKPIAANAPASSPGHNLVAKYAAEAAINNGELDYAAGLLKPIESANPNDWQAESLMARIYAESRQADKRNTELARLKDQHESTSDPRFSRLQQILLERIPLKSGSLRVWYSLVPWGRYKVYVFARVFDASGKQVLRITLESSDFDQPLWAKQHPDLAAKGERMFSMDGYGEGTTNPNGTRTETHATFGFFDGQPSYDTVRARMVAIAENKSTPISRTDGIVQPAKP